MPAPTPITIADSVALLAFASSIVRSGGRMYGFWATSQPTTQPEEAVLQYVAPFQALAGISYGMTAVDNRALILDQRTTARVASGLRTVSFSCPNASSLAGGSQLRFNFKAGQAYELVCREGQPAEIRAAGC